MNDIVTELDHLKHRLADAEGILRMVAEVDPDEGEKRAKELEREPRYAFEAGWCRGQLWRLRLQAALYLRCRPQHERPKAKEEA